MGEKLNKLVNEKISDVIAKVEAFTKDTEKAILLLTACKSNIINLLNIVKLLTKYAAEKPTPITDEDKAVINKAMADTESLLKMLEE